MSAPTQGVLAVPIDIKQPDKKLKARGLTVYISDIRNCTTREQEEARVREEMANIRHKFTKAGKTLSSYDKRKYVWKIVYTHMLGYAVDFGHMQTIELLASQVYNEKMCGYLALTLLVKNSDEIMNLVVNTMKRDLQLTASPAVHCLALTAAANLGGAMLAHAIAEDVRRLVKDDQVSPTVQKKALLCLLRLARDAPQAVSLPGELELANMANRDLSLTAAACAVLKHVILERERRAGAPMDDRDDDETAEDALLWARHQPQVQAVVVRLLHQLTVTRAVDKKQYYNGTVNPFVQVALMEILVAIKTLPPAVEIQEPLFESLRAILKGVQWTQSPTVNNASRCASFDAIALVAGFGKKAPASLVDAALQLSGRFIESKNPNTRYLALSALCVVADSVLDRDAGDPWLVRLRQLHPTIVASLKDKDATVRKRALNLLFHLCDADNAPVVVQEMLEHLRSSVFLDGKPEVVLRIAILAERFAKDSRWYVSTALRLIEIGGEYVADDVWYRVAQIIANDESIQRHAALLSYKALLSPQHVHAAMVRVAAHVLGEFGYLLVESPTLGALDHDVLAIDLFGAIHRHFQFASAPTRALILVAYAKLLNLYEDLAVAIEEVFESVKRSPDADVQQRACELALIAKLAPDTIHYLLEPMPPWPHDRQSPLIRRLAEVEASVTSSPRPAQPSSSSRAMGGAVEEADLHAENGGDDPNVNADVVVDAAPLLTYKAKQEQRRLFLNALLSAKSLLYDEAGLQVGSHQTFTLGRGRVSVFVGNTGDEDFDKVFVELDGDQARGSKLVALQASTVPEVLTAGQQFEVEFVLDCQGPFDAPPVVYISASKPGAEAPAVVKLNLPVSLCSFAEPVAMKAEDFAKRWAALANAGAQAVVMLSGAADWASSVAKALKCFDLLHMASVPEWPLDAASADDYALASVLRTTASHPGTGAPVTVGFLVRVEMNAQARAARVSVRAAHVAVATYVLPLLTEQLERLFV